MHFLLRTKTLSFNIQVLKIMQYFSPDVVVEYSCMYRSCRGSVDKTTDSQPEVPGSSPSRGSSALRQGTLSSSPSPSEGTLSCRSRGCLLNEQSYCFLSGNVKQIPLIHALISTCKVFHIMIDLLDLSY